MQASAGLDRARPRCLRRSRHGDPDARRRPFRAAQGGSLSQPRRVGRGSHGWSTQGAVGIGQSSWGPTGFAFAPSEEAAEALLDAAPCATCDQKRHGVQRSYRRQDGNPGAKISSTGRDARRQLRFSKERRPKARKHGPTTTYPAHADAAEAYEPVRREHGARCRLRRGRALYQRHARGGDGPGAGRDLLAPARSSASTPASSSAARTRRWRSTCSTRRRRRMVPPFEVFGLRRPGRLVHHRRGDGRLVEKRV